jgi:hypothetical protein
VLIREGAQSHIESLRSFGTAVGSEQVVQWGFDTQMLIRPRPRHTTASVTASARSPTTRRITHYWTARSAKVWTAATTRAILAMAVSPPHARMYLNPGQKKRLREVGEGGVEVGVEILRILEANAEPDHAVADTDESATRCPYAPVRCGGRVRGQAFGVADVV